jgi:hypothetical protein
VREKTKYYPKGNPKIYWGKKTYKSFSTEKKNVRTVSIEIKRKYCRTFKDNNSTFKGLEVRKSK